MKYYLLAGAIILAGAAAVFLSPGKSPKVSDSDHFAAKRHVAEAETKVRPSHFEEMKWKPIEGVDMRAPASTDNTNKN